MSWVVPLTVEQIDNCIKQLKFGKAAGPNGLTAEHLKYAHPALAVHLKFLMRVMLSYGYVCEAFGLIVPLVKDKLADHNKVENYRGMRLTAVISKLSEYVNFQLTESKLQTYSLQFSFLKRPWLRRCYFYIRKCCWLFYM